MIGARLPARFAPVLGVMLVLAPAPPAGAESVMRCAHGVVSRGDSAQLVRDRCGAPATIETRSREVRTVNAAGVSVLLGHETYELWVYELGYGRFRRHLEFSARGTLEHIVLGARQQ